MAHYNYSFNLIQMRSLDSFKSDQPDVLEIETGKDEYIDDKTFILKDNTVVIQSEEYFQAFFNKLLKKNKAVLEKHITNFSLEINWDETECVYDGVAITVSAFFKSKNDVPEKDQIELAIFINN